MLHSRETTRAAAVMMEIVIRGIAATLGLPYDEMLRTVNEGGDLRAMLQRSGHLRKPEAPDEEQDPASAE
jgi:hypothetical protein